MKSVILESCVTHEKSLSKCSAECDLPTKSCDLMEEYDPEMCEEESQMSCIFILYLAVATHTL